MGSLSLIMDIIVLVSLAVTIFYAIRLSRSLNSFRQYRQEFGQLMQELSRSIDQAYEAIEQMKNAEVRSGEGLGDSVGEAQYLLDELQLITQSGNSLADRLENLAQQGRKSIGHELKVDVKEEGRQVFQEEPRAFSSTFSIQDRDIESEKETGEHSESFSSQAEQELYAALKKKPKSGRG